MAEVTQTIKSLTTGKALAVFYDDGTIRIDGIRASYPHMDKPWAKADKQNPNPTPVFSITGLMPKKEYRPVKDAIVKFNEQLMAEAKIDFVKPESKYIRDGDSSGKPEAAGCWIVASRDSRPPFRKGPDNRNLTDQQAKDLIYPGAFVSMLIRPWAQKSTEYGKRLNCGIVGVKALGGGERIGEGGYDDEDIDDRFAGAEANGGFDDDDNYDTDDL